MRKTGKLLILICLLVVSAEVFSSSADLISRNAAQAYADGNYPEAVSLYRKLTSEGFDGAQVRYNIGNCYLKQGDIGRAIVAYKRALDLDPGMHEALHNLDVARKLLAARAASWEPSPWESFLSGMPPLYMDTALLAIAFAGNIFLCLILIMDPGRLRRLFVQLMIAAFILAGATMGLSAYSRVVRQTHKPAVVVETASVYDTPEVKRKPLAHLPPGSEIIEVKRVGEWCFVLWGEGRGWTRSSNVEVP